MLPLSIAYFDGEGRYLDALEMQPCTADPCPCTASLQPFVDAVEVPPPAVSRRSALTPGSDALRC